MGVTSAIIEVVVVSIIIIVCCMSLLLLLLLFRLMRVVAFVAIKDVLLRFIVIVATTKVTNIRNEISTIATAAT